MERIPKTHSTQIQKKHFKMKYTYNIDIGELLTEVKEFDSDEKALAYGQDLFKF